MRLMICSDARRRWLALALVVALVALGVLVWAAPRDQGALPGRDATPERVVRAYIKAVNERDFDTANAIDARTYSHLGRFSRPMQTHAARRFKTMPEGRTAHVVFIADFEGPDAVEDGPWGYLLQRGPNGRWHIVDAGVA